MSSSKWQFLGLPDGVDTTSFTFRIMKRPEAAEKVEIEVHEVDRYAATPRGGEICWALQDSTHIGTLCFLPLAGMTGQFSDEYATLHATFRYHPSVEKDLDKSKSFTLRFVEPSRARQVNPIRRPGASLPEKSHKLPRSVEGEREVYTSREPIYFPRSALREGSDADGYAEIALRIAGDKSGLARGAVVHGTHASFLHSPWAARRTFAFFLNGTEGASPVRRRLVLARRTPKTQVSVSSTSTCLRSKPDLLTVLWVSEGGEARELACIVNLVTSAAPGVELHGDALTGTVQVGLSDRTTRSRVRLFESDYIWDFALLPLCGWNADAQGGHATFGSFPDLDNPASKIIPKVPLHKLKWAEPDANLPFVGPVTLEDFEYPHVVTKLAAKVWEYQHLEKDVLDKYAKPAVECFQALDAIQANVLAWQEMRRKRAVRRRGEGPREMSAVGAQSERAAALLLGKVANADNDLQGQAEAAWNHLVGVIEGKLKNTAEEVLALFKASESAASDWLRLELSAHPGFLEAHFIEVEVMAMELLARSPVGEKFIEHLDKQIVEWAGVASAKVKSPESDLTGEASFVSKMRSICGTAIIKSFEASVLAANRARLGDLLRHQRTATAALTAFVYWSAETASQQKHALTRLGKAVMTLKEAGMVDAKKLETALLTWGHMAQSLEFNMNGLLKSTGGKGFAKMMEQSMVTRVPLRVTAAVTTSLSSIALVAQLSGPLDVASSLKAGEYLGNVASDGTKWASDVLAAKAANAATAASAEAAEEFRALSKRLGNYSRGLGIGASLFKFAWAIRVLYWDAQEKNDNAMVVAAFNLAGAGFALGGGIVALVIATSPLGPALAVLGLALELVAIGLADPNKYTIKSAALQRIDGLFGLLAERATEIPDTETKKQFLKIADDYRDRRIGGTLEKMLGEFEGPHENEKTMKTIEWLDQYFADHHMPSGQPWDPL